MCKCIKRSMQLFVLLTIGIAYSYSQSQASDSLFLLQNIWTLQFGVTGNSSATIAVKNQLSETNAIRVGILITDVTQQR